MLSFFTRNHKDRAFVRIPRRPLYRPCLETLEDRCLLSSGVLDPTFNPGGSPPGTEVSSSSSGAEAVAIYPSTDTTGNANKIVVAGSQQYQRSNGSWTYRMAVGRFNPDGSPDTTFNGTGSEYLTFTNSTNGVSSGASAVAIQPDGKIVVAGNSEIKGVTDFAVVRFNVDGSLDTTFNKTGYVQTNVSGSGNNEANSMVLQSNGDIVVAGRTVSGSNYVSAIVRYTPSGTLDTTWGKKGIDILDIGASGSWFNAVALENGQAVATGQAVAPGASTNGFDVVRFTTSGQLDSTFGSGGIVYTLPQGTGGDIAHALTVQADGKLVAAGEVDTLDSNPNDPQYNSIIAEQFALARYNTDGTLDTTFNGTGRVTLPLQGSTINLSTFTAVLYQPADGKIVAAGSEEYGGFAVARFNPDGSADTSFGSNGLTTTNFGDVSLGSPNLTGAALQPDGRIVVVGGARQRSAPSGWLLGMARYLASEPQIGSFTANPNQVTSGSSETLTASNITDGNPNSSITQVTFYYYDSNGNKVVLGYGTEDSSGDWILNFAVNLASGTYTLYAQAQDNYGVVGDPDALTLTVQ